MSIMYIILCLFLAEYTKYTKRENINLWCLSYRIAALWIRNGLHGYTCNEGGLLIFYFFGYRIKSISPLSKWSISQFLGFFFCCSPHKWFGMQPDTFYDIDMIVGGAFGPYFEFGPGNILFCIFIFLYIYLDRKLSN